MPNATTNCRCGIRNRHRTYCKIEKGDRRTRRGQVIALAQLLQADREELLSLWLADQVYYVIKNEEHTDKALNIVAENIVEYERRK